MEKIKVLEFEEEGVYTVKLEVRDEDGLVDEATNLIHVIGFGAKGTIVDTRDGQVYSTVEIGDKVWLSENMNYYITNSWGSDTHVNSDTMYGRLYNWDMAQTVCPEGWHLPSDDEWANLEILLGMDYQEVSEIGIRRSDLGFLLKSEEGWDLDGNGNDKIGMNMKPGGSALENGYFNGSGSYGSWWTATENDDDKSINRTLMKEFSGILRNYHDKTQGYSIRCLKD